ncbi:thioredoxin family protein [Leuconostoc citreum]|uniref:thioredoxin family protein n=1 Tax=Leuconostoc citreum TaxID=33964 RepID=UPI0032DFF2A2
MKKIIGIGAVCLVAVVTTVFLWYNNHYHDKPKTQINRLLAKDVGQQVKVIVFHKTGCARCEALREEVNQLKKVRDRCHETTVVMDYMNKATRPYFSDYQVNVVPTILLVKKGQIIKQYVQLSHEQMREIARE